MDDDVVLAFTVIWKMRAETLFPFAQRKPPAAVEVIRRDAPGLHALISGVLVVVVVLLDVVDVERLVVVVVVEVLWAEIATRLRN